MALRNTFEIPIGGRASIKVTIELNDDHSGASRANRMLLAEITGKVSSAIAESGRDQSVEPEPTQGEVVRIKSESAEREPAQGEVDHTRPVGQIFIIVLVQDGSTRGCFYKVKQTTKFGTIRDREAERLGRPWYSLCLVHNGLRVGEGTTIEECGAREGDVVEVHYIGPAGQYFTSSEYTLARGWRQ